MTDVYLAPEQLIEARRKMAEFTQHVMECPACAAEWNRRAAAKLPLYMAPRNKDITVYTDNLCRTGVVAVIMAAKAASELWNGALWLKS